MPAVIFLSVITAAVILLTVVEIIILIKQKAAPDLPSDSEYYNTRINGKSFEDLYAFLCGDGETFFAQEEIYEFLKRQTEYIKNRYDCADFRAQLLFKIYKDCHDKLSTECRELIKSTFLGFKYFMDEPGDDSMCYWSENHQILFAVSEYLAGQEWEAEIFTNSNMTGLQHKEKAKERIDAWMHQRFSFGFSEYLSNNYLAEDIAPMANFIAYAHDPQAVERMKIITDLLWLDVALHCTKNRFVSTSTRMYGNNKIGNIYGNSIVSAMNVLWGREAAEKLLCSPDTEETEKALITEALQKKPNYITVCFTDIVKKGLYTLPEAIKDIALCEDSFVSKMSCGLSEQDMVKEKLVGEKPHQIMAQWGAEGFTNPELIENTLQYVKNNNMYRNAFIGYFRFLNLTVLKKVNWKKFAEKHNIMPHGILTGRGNIYAYSTPLYTLATSVMKDVDMCGAQEHIWVADIAENLTLFTTHPAGNGKGRFGSSPGYWIGNGRRPASAQHKNVNITIYKIPEKNRFGEFGISKITHAYMPREFYDELTLSGNTVTARKNNVFVALISDGLLSYKPFDKASADGIHKHRNIPENIRLSREFDLVRQGGRYHTYITEISDSTKETYDAFCERIRKNTADFTADGSVTYITDGNTLSLSYKGDFKVNEAPEDTEYLRYDSRFCRAPRKPDSIFIDSGKHTLLLDYKNTIEQTKKVTPDA